MGERNPPSLFVNYKVNQDGSRTPIAYFYGEKEIGSIALLLDEGYPTEEQAMEAYYKKHGVY